MDRASRFQNAVPLSSGSLNKAPQIQNDGVGMKPMPPSILDRFRAMVKEREEELRAFGGGPLGTDEIVRLYEILLSELTINSKPIITDLTIIAGDQRAHGEGIADAICARIIEVPIDQKLPSLYLLDSIVKNIGKEYIKYFSARLPEVFCEAYAQVHPSMHQAMRHLFGTWSAVFPSSVLQNIEAQLQFSPSVNGQSSGLGASTRSESPRPTHGIHINPKYLEAQRQFGHSTVGTEGLSSTGRAGLATSGLDAVKKSLPSASRIMRSSSPYRVGHAGSLSPSLEEFSMDSSPTRVAIGASPSGQGIDYGLSRVMGREEETSEWRTRNWQGTSNQHLKASAAHKYSNGVDLRGPRALISAYGIDEREKHLKPRNQLDANGADKKVAMRTWQNTEEEEFDWEDMTPALADRRHSNEIYSSLPPPGNVLPRNSFSTNHAAALVTDYGGNLTKPGRGSINKIVEVFPNVAGPSDLPIQIPPSFRESLILPHLQSQSHLNVKGGGSFSESRSSLTGGEQKLPLIDNFSNTDGKLGGPSSTASTFSSTYDTPISDIRTAHDAALTKAWRPAKFQTPHMPSLSALPPQMHIRGQYGMKTAPNIVADQGLNKTIYSEQHLGTTRNMPQVTLPLIPSQRPSLIPINLQGTAQPSLAQSMAQGAGQLPSSVPAPSNTMVPPKSYGYLAHAQGPPIGTTSLSNIVPGVQSSLPVLNAPNMSFHVPGAALQPLPGVPLPGTSQALPSGQTVGRVAPNPPGGGALSGLISSLVAQGLISLTKQDSVGVEFDQDSLKVRHESTITALYADLPRQCKTCGLRFKSQEEHSKHMDWHVNKNRTLKTRKTKPSPKWFVSVSMWLSGAEALGTEAVPGFLPAENTVEKPEDEEMAVPADEDQNTCALCGEPFDDFYSDEMEEWMYKGAVYMYAPAGSIVGMDRSQLGPIVHAKCRSDSHGIPPEEKDERESTEEGSQRKRLRS
ncbi:polyadenylation and cleavage factor homolog 4 isoform X2 [Sesamum indicum]|uniref:Polyadenylation and cleavage factor homolog 4 isoform X2 n=1 Tax=Sesamum indicum TaxID=4182 RepID=A0A6I9T293_SESIN|nr:polyadenylation and cleavage factor homolog 4 isoform X2 [Sesamum indicum]